MTTPPTAGAVGAGDEVPDTAGAFALATRKPKRVGGAFDVRVEDVALFPDMESDEALQAFRFRLRVEVVGRYLLTAPSRVLTLAA